MARNFLEKLFPSNERRSKTDGKCRKKKEEKIQILVRTSYIVSYIFQILKIRNLRNVLGTNPKTTHNAAPPKSINKMKKHRGRSGDKNTLVASENT